MTAVPNGAASTRSSAEPPELPLGGRTRRTETSSPATRLRCIWFESVRRSHDRGQPDRDGQDGSRSARFVPTRRSSWRQFWAVPSCAATSSPAGISGRSTSATPRATTFETIVQGNFIGTDVTGTVELWETRSPASTSGRRTSPSAGPAREKATSSRSTRGAGVYLVRAAPSAARSAATRSTRTTTTHSSAISASASTSAIRLRSSAIPASTTWETPTTGPTAARTFRSSRPPWPRWPRAARRRSPGGSTARANTSYDLDFYSNPACAGRPQAFLEGEDVPRLGAGDDRRQRQRGHQRRPTGHDRRRREGDRDGDRSRRQHLGVLAAHRAEVDTGLRESVGRARHARRLPLPRRRDGDRRRRRGDRRERRELQPDHGDHAVASARQPQQRHRDEHRRQRRDAAQRLDRGLPRRAGQPAVLRERHDPRAQRDHGRCRRRQLRRRAGHPAPADGRLPPQGEERRSATCRPPAPSRPSPTCPAPRTSPRGSTSSSPRASPAAAATASTAR